MELKRSMKAPNVVDNPTESVHALKYESGYSQITKKPITNTTKIREKSERKKTERENFHYVNDDYNCVLWIGST